MHMLCIKEKCLMRMNGGWLQWMKNCFKYGTIGEHWKLVQSEGWLNPDFENFLNKEVAPKPGPKLV